MILAFKDEYGWLSNFVDVDIEWDGGKYKSVEHAYQSAKSSDRQWKIVCASGISSGKVKRASRKIEVRQDWEKIKVSVMKDLLKQKFSDEYYKDKLLATGNTYIIEGNEWGDTFWGVDLRSGEGRNVLGRLIMELRDSLHSEQSGVVAKKETAPGLS